jgi:hypothetical protein
MVVRKGERRPGRCRIAVPSRTVVVFLDLHNPGGTSRHQPLGAGRSAIPYPRFEPGPSFFVSVVTGDFRT